MAEYLKTIASEFGIHHTTLWRWSKRDDFPKPESDEDRWPRYNIEQVRDWMSDWEPTTGRPLGSKVINGKVVEPRFRPGSRRKRDNSD